MADLGSSDGALVASGDWVAGLTSGTARDASAADVEEAGFADTSDVVRTESPVAELVAFLADVDSGVGDDGALNALRVDVRALLVDAESLDG